MTLRVIGMKKIFSIIVVLLIILVIMILSIKTCELNVYYDDSSYKINEHSIKPNSIKIYKDNIYFDVDFKIPGEYYEFNVNIVNDSNMDVKLEDVVIVKLDKESNLIKSYVTYFNGKPTKKGDILKANDSIKYVIHVEYNSDISIEDLNRMPTDINLSIPINYIQA